MSEQARPAFMTDPAILGALEGQASVVLRLGGPIAELFAETRRKLVERLAGLPVTYPNSAHVTIRGYPAGVDLQAVSRISDRWAAQTPPLAINLTALDVFRAPFRVVIFKVRQTDVLQEAFGSILRESQAEGLPFFRNTPQTVDEWTFHISLAYCGKLSGEQWRPVVEFVKGIEVPATEIVVDEAELVWYVRGREYSRVLKLSKVATFPGKVED